MNDNPFGPYHHLTVSRADRENDWSTFGKGDYGADGVFTAEDLWVGDYPEVGVRYNIAAYRGNDRSQYGFRRWRCTHRNPSRFRSW